jgi:hypothetical protein
MALGPGPAGLKFWTRPLEPITEISGPLVGAEDGDVSASIGPVTGTFFNPARTSNYIILSNTNLTATLTGFPAVTGAIAVTEAADTSAMIGPPGGALAALEAADIAAMAGTNGAAAAAIAFVSGSVAGSPDSTGVVVTINTTGANFLVAAISDYGATTMGPLIDEKSNTWVPLTTYSDGVSRIRMFYSVPTSVGSGHTLHAGASGTYPSLAFAAFSGVNAAPFDKEAGTTGNSTAPAGWSVTPAVGNSLVVSAMGTVGGTGTAIGGSTIIGSLANSGGLYLGIGLAYSIQATTAAVNPTWTLSAGGQWSATNAVFKP